MSYLVLARKWRPQTFEDLIGQRPIVRILTNSIEQEKTAHAYVFSGPRGVGKTSTARILAKGLNCATGPTPTPCGECDSCASVTSGSSVDVIEIDGASNNSVEDIRNLRDRVKYAPSGSKFKVYIIDEAHMLSTSAFNALLKTLEEPPPHVVFVLATTEPRKIPLTVMSRCQHLPFRRIPLKEINDRLKFIAQSEGISISDHAIGMVARAADGSIRDSLTILDQLTSFSADVDDADIKDLLDLADFSVLSSMAESIIFGNREQVLGLTGELVDRGTDLRTFTKDLIKFFRDLLVIKLTSGEEMTDSSAEELATMKDIASRVSDEYLILILSELVKAESDVKSSFSPRVALEMALLKISYLSVFRDVKEAIESLSSAGAGGAGGAAVYIETKKPLPEPEPVFEPEPAPEAEPKPAIDPEPEPMAETDGEVKTPRHEGSVKSYDGDGLVQAIARKMDDAKIASFLTRAKGKLKGNTLNLTFNSSEADICAEPFRENPGLIENPASELIGSPVKVEIRTKHIKSMGKKELKEKVISEPVVREALDLFDGTVVDVRQSKER